MASTPLTDDERQQIRDLHAAGHGCNQIARELGRDRSTISRAAADMSLSFDRKQTRQATQARVDDARARRSKLALDLLGDAERLRKQLWEPCTIHSFGGRENVYSSELVNEPPFRDKRDILASVGLAVDKSMRLLDYDANSGASEARSMLSAIAEALEVAAEHLPPDEG
ncbi:helix-turn-helix domain-containing protein [Nonomuraea sediminis]|uniref:helix-turn-helix domain-containing protein n=1 Tax=Nonomuraea sediminis TaxID=2835864 RepID=UPI001BDD6DAC|nr:helix-turn-helix domain-containing protein [Nonomuraea sediminis]